MRKTQLIKILTKIAQAYPDRFKYPRDTEEETRLFQETWFEMLEGFDYPLVLTAVKKLFTTNQYPPSVHDLLQAIRDIQKTEEERLTAGEAWEMVTDYAREIMYRRGVECTLPTAAQRAARAVGGYRRIAMRLESEDSYMQDRFAKTYNQIREREEEQAILPESLRSEIQAISGRMAVPGEMFELSSGRRRATKDDTGKAQRDRGTGEGV